MKLRLPLHIRAWGVPLLVSCLFIAPLRVRADDQIFRMGMSAALMKDVNENDAKAALTSWMQTLSEHTAVTVDTSVPILSGGDAFVRAFRSKEIDCVTLTTEEFLILDHEAGTTNLLAENGDGAGDVYVLLAREGSGITNLAHLKGRELLLSDSMRMSLGMPWLDVVFMREGLPEANRLFRAITRKRKLANIVLPVFFGSAEVCLVPQRGFEAMVEMNPQVGKQLRVIAKSPVLVAGLVCFRAEYPEPNLSKITTCLLGFQKTARGLQVLTLFQASAVGNLTRSSLDSAIDLLAEHRRFSAQAAPPETTTPP